MAQWIRRLTSNQTIVGSIPTGCVFYIIIFFPFLFVDKIIIEECLIKELY